MRYTPALSSMLVWRSARMAAARSPSGWPARSSSIRVTAPAGSSGSSAWLAPAAYSPAWTPARLPNTTMSSSELVPSRLAPCTETQAHSPAANSPGMTVLAASPTTWASTSVGMPPMA